MKNGQDKYRFIFENLPDAFAYHRVVTDGGNNNVLDYIFLDVNRAFEEMAGFSREQVIGRTVKEVLAGSEMSEFDWISAYGKVALSGEPLSLEKHFKLSDRRYYITVYSDESGCFATIFRDISDITARQINEEVRLQLAEETINKQNRLLEGIVDGIPDVLAVQNPDHTIERLNKYGYELLNMEPTIAKGKKCYELIGRDRECEVCATREALKTKKMEQAEIYIPELGVYFDCCSNPILNKEGNVVHIVERLRDITKQKRQEKRLRESEEKYRMLSENASDVIWTTDLDLNFTFVSPSCEYMSGFTVEEIMSISIDKILTPASLKLATQALQKELEMWSLEPNEQGRVTTLELKQFSKDGSTDWVELKATFIRDQEGRPTGILGITRDINDRKKAEKALKKSERNYREIFNSTYDAILVHDRATGDVVDVNEAAVRMYGCESKTELIHGNIDDFSNVAAGYNKEKVKEMIQTAPSLKSQTFEWQAKKKNGRFFWVEVSLKLKQIEGEEKILAVVRDITERRQAEEALRKTVANINALLVNSPTLISIFDQNGRYVEVSAAMARFFRLSQEEMRGKTFTDLLPPETAQEFFNTIHELKKNQQVITKTDDIQIDGETRSYETLLFPVEQKGTDIELFGAIALDITDRKRAEQKLAEYTKNLEKLNRQLDDEIEKALQIHKRTVPNDIPKVEGVSLEAYYRPAQKLSGDFYNVIKANNKLILYLSDVMGHGMDGSMLSFFVKEAIDSFVTLKPNDLHPGKILSHLDQQYRRNNYPEEYLICIFLAVLDLETMDLSYSVAGFQTSPLVRMGDGAKLKLTNKGLPIAAAVEPELMTFKVKHLSVTSGTTIFFSTDGLTEQTVNGQMYKERLENIFFENSHLPPSLIAKTVTEDFRSFNMGSIQGSDDITFCILQVDPELEGAMSLELESRLDELERLRKEAYGLISGQQKAEIFLSCLNELAANAMEHGNKLDPMKKVIVEIRITNRYISAIVEDRGDGFNWNKKINASLDLQGIKERGRGITMVKIFCDGLLYNEKGNRALIYLKGDNA